jgi:type I restriction enzyme, R subunit
MDEKPAMVLISLGRQFELGGIEALETPELWQVPEIRDEGGLNALKTLGSPQSIMKEAKTRLFAA